ncbi:MAG: hypothetical protein LBU13_07410 [Synergistaceae bacterium]|jgi:hypothetical protein|nr:hypothetical protein [Synergistaceae bacterium]
MLTSLSVLVVLFIAIFGFAAARKNTLNMVFVLCACFPYFKLFGVGTDTDIQLYTFGVAALIVLANMAVGGEKRVIFCGQANSFLQYCVLLAAMIVTVTIIRAFGLDYVFFYYLRGFMPYFTIIILPLATYITISKCGIAQMERLLKFAYYAWIIVGVIQIVFPDFMMDIKSRTFNGGGRGSVSMAPEPAYYAIQLLLINFILYIVDAKRYKWLICPTALTVLLVALSATGTFYVLCFMFVFYATRKMMLPLLLVVLASVGLMFLFRHNLEQTRLYYLVTKIIAEPHLIIVADGSLNSRVVEWIFSVKGFMENIGMPRGVLNWADYVYEQNRLFPEWFFRSLSLGSYWNKLSSMLGALLFEAGVFAMPLLRYFARFSKQGTGNYKPFLFIMILSVNALNYTNPLFNVLIGFMIYQANVVSMLGCNERLRNVEAAITLKKEMSTT